MRTRPPLLAFVAVCALTGGLAVGAGTAASPPPDAASAGAAPPIAPALAGFGADQVVLRAHVQPDGHATWAVTYRRELAGPNATAAFREYRNASRERPITLTGPFREDMAAVAADARRRTGRSMAVQNVTVNASRTGLAGETGRVTFRFRWTNFAATKGGRLRTDGALGEFVLTEDVTLVVSWPDRYDRVSVSPSPDEGGDVSVTWEGRRAFAANEPLVVVRSTSIIDRLGLPAILVVLLGALLVAGVGWRRYRDDGASAPGEPRAGDRDGAPGGRATSGDGTDATAGAETGPGADETSGAAAAGPAASDAAGADEDDAAVPSELLSREERLLELLERRGGRVKQQAIVETLDWSETKTSEVVNDLEDDDRIEVYRIGRENVVALPGEMDV